MNIIIGNLKNNKKTSLLFLFNIVLSFTLIFMLILFFSSTLKYLTDKTVKEVGDYHVMIETDLKNYEDFSVIKKVKWQDNKVLITYNEIKDVYKNTKNICKQVKCDSINYNEIYLSLKGVSKNSYLKTFKNLLFIILIIILLSCSFIIYNMYKIFLHQRYKQISILQSLGMPLKKIKVLYVKESMIYCLLSFMVSLPISIIISKILLLIVSHLLEDKISLSFNVVFLLTGLLFIFLLTIFIMLLPILKAKKLSNIMLLKPKIKRFKLKRKSDLNLLGYKMAKNNYKPVIISLCILLILYFTFNLLLNCTLKIINRYVVFPDYDILVTSKNYADLKDLANGAKKYKIYKMCVLNMDIMTKKGVKNMNLYITDGNNKYINSFKKVDIQKEKIKLINEDYFDTKLKININNQEYEFVKENKIPFGLNTLIGENNLILQSKDIDNFGSPIFALYMKTDKNIKLKGGEEAYVNVKEKVKMINNIIVLIKVMLYFCLGLCFIISFLNLISSTFLSAEYQRKETLLLKSLGFTNKQFKDMLVLESLMITLKVSFLSLPFILLINYIITSLIITVTDIDLILDFKYYIVCILFILIFTRIIISWCYHYEYKQNIIKLYDENI